PPPSPPPAGGGVDQDPAGVGLDRLDPAQPPPGQVGLGQRGLEQVLGGGPVPREQVRGTQQGTRPGRDELAELLLQTGISTHRTASHEWSGQIDTDHIRRPEGDRNYAPADCGSSSVSSLVPPIRASTAAGSYISSTTRRYNSFGLGRCGTTRSAWSWPADSITNVP